MSGGLFLVRKDEAVTVLQPASFSSEDAFQRLIERFPELLTQLDGPASRKWVLVQREAGVPDAQDAADRWALDHLFLDEQGVPTLVEIKRSSDTRTRREVVAQLLEYAANATRWWSIETLQNWFMQNAGCDPVSGASRLSELFGDEKLEWDGYWRAVSANMTAGRIRLVIAADLIQPELERIVEFLNEQMNPATILALELRLFENGEDRILAPRLIGATTRAEDQKSVRKDVAASVEDWLSRGGDDERERAFVEQMKLVGATVVVTGQSLAFDAGSARFAYLRHRNRISLSLWNLKRFPSLTSDEQRKTLIQRFVQAGFQPSTSDLGGEPSFNIPYTRDAERFASIVGVFKTLIDQLK